MDQLKRAWELLGEGERPTGLGYSPAFGWSSGAGLCFELTSEPVAYDRLCHAVEGVLLGRGLYHRLAFGNHWWLRYVDKGVMSEVDHDPDRLAAACNALEAERKANA